MSNNLKTIKLKTYFLFILFTIAICIGTDKDLLADDLIHQLTNNKSLEKIE